MLEQGDGAILTAQGGSTVQGLPYMSGPSPAQAAERNYLQALRAEVAGKGVYVGMLYIGAAIKNSAFHAEMEKAIAAGDPVWEMPTVDPEHLGGLLWTMHGTKGQPEAILVLPLRARTPLEADVCRIKPYWIKATKDARDRRALAGRAALVGLTHLRDRRP